MTVNYNEPQLIKNFISTEKISKMCEYTDFLDATNRSLEGDTQAPHSDVYLKDNFLDMMGYQSKADVEHHTGKKIYPTYVYARRYHPKSELVPHTDRVSCEISVTVCLEKEFSDLEWPIHIEYEDKVLSYNIEPGDALLYHGAVHKHWRDPLEKGWIKQIFFHYIDIEGPLYSQILTHYPKLGDFKMRDVNN